MRPKAPYKGLRPYEESDEDNFFGREGETRILVDKVLTRKLTLLFAASGIGKSSLLQAALQPSLKRPATDHDTLDVVYCNDWVRDPGATLKAKVAKTLKDQGKLPHDYRLVFNAPLDAFLRRCTLFSSDPMVLILDQFEEFFNYQRHQSEFYPFIRELSAAIRDDATTTRFVFSMREDFALELNAFKRELPSLLFDNYYRLDALSCTKAREVIIEPLKKIGYDCEPALLKSLLEKLGQCKMEQAEVEEGDSQLSDVPRSPIEPPQIQIICTQLWEKERVAGSKYLRLATYQAMGETDGLLKRYFDDKMAPFTGQQKGLASRSFDFLVSSQGTKMAYPLFELVNRTGIKNAKSLESVLDKLEKARILRRQKRLLSKDGESWREPYYELYHDLFARPMNYWNREYKRQRHQIQAILGITGLVVGALLLYGGYTIVNQVIHHHLRLSPPAGLSDRIELWSGARHGLDLLHHRGYLAETRFDREQVSPDKQSQYKAVEEYQELNPELIGQLPLTQRIEAYRRAGLEEQALKLADRALLGSDRELSAKVMRRLVWFHTNDVVPVVKGFLKYETYPNRRSQLVKDWKLIPAAQAVPLLKLALEDNVPSVKSEVARSLGGFAGRPGGEQAVAPLMDLLKDRNANVVSRAAYALRAYAGQAGGEQAVGPLVALLEDTNPDVRRSAANALWGYAGQPGGEQALGSLVALLKDENPDVRRVAAKALSGYAGQPGGEQALGPLVALLTDLDPDVVSWVAYVLRGYAGQAGGEQAVVSLVDLLEDENPDVRRVAAKALSGYAGQSGGEQAVAPLVALLEDTNPADVRRVAAKALSGYAGQPGGEWAVAPLVALLEDTNSDVRRSAAKALRGYAGQPGGERAVTPLLTLLNDKLSRVQQSAVDALGGYAGQPGGEQAVAPLAALLADTSSKSQVRDSAANALSGYAGQSGGEQALGSLVALLKDENPDVRDSAANALSGYAGQSGGEQALGSLVALLKDENPDVRRVAAKALSGYAGQPGGEQVVGSLVALLKDENPDVRRVAAKALSGYAGQPGGEQALGPLVALLTDLDPDVRHRAASAFRGYAGQPGGERAVAPLLALLKDQRSNVDRSAAKALRAYAGQSGGEQAVGSLVALLEDPNEDVRSVAAYALRSYAGQPGGEQAVGPLVALLTDLAPDVRASAADALGGYAGQPGGERAVGPLVALLEDRNPDVRHSAASAFRGYAGQPGGERAVDPLVALLEDTNPVVRRSAVGALGGYAGQPGTEQALARLVALLEDTNPVVRRSAVGALGGYAGQVGAERAVSPLVALLEDSDSNIQENAMSSLARFAGQVEIRAANPYLENLRKVETGKIEYLATLSLALINPDRVSLNAPGTLRSPPITKSNQVGNVSALHRDQNAILLIDGFDALDKETQISILPELGRFPSPQILSKLKVLEQQDDADIRIAALLAMGGIPTQEALIRLQSVARDQQELRRVRVQAIRALGRHSNSEIAVESLTELAKQEPSFINEVYAVLDRQVSPASLTFLERGLAQEMGRHQRWREFRQTWQEEFDDEKSQDKRNDWIEELKARQPTPALETWFARQIARLDPKRAAELLRNDIYAVRQGAWLGIAQSSVGLDVGWLADRHAEEDNPLFRFALYRAIDLLLRRLEVEGGTEDLKTLEALRKQWNTKQEEEQLPKSEWTAKRQVQQTILKRINWTLAILRSRLE